ncbi:hypothetical protein POF50_008875 [Streptomyces sp. SL13]|uniref:Uncharacterized protein n=1 Tax=Streptantibioticus silvisoli TaxID=2705255 RepID=A0AA90H396_9ACTN|nr:hypothetical protein [Streptantibioticus silvisoli]MDI5969452.1 hypothetical protein [Streptantibioticus silvisoli]
MAHEQAQQRQQHSNGTAHRTTTVERGPFALARCSCGWTGPARRARARARQDAAGHCGTA